ncbi:hypothetical protein ACSSS7_004691 [Eimeria intestinalis]
MAGGLSQLGLAGGAPQSFALVAEVEKAPDSMRLLFANTEGALVPHQTKQGIFYRAVLRAATAYVAILAVAFLILLCVGRLSSPSAEGGSVRSLAGAEGNEAAGACGSNGEEGHEDGRYEEDGAVQQAIIEQARENMEGYRAVISKLVALRSASTYKSVHSATSVYLLFLSDMGALGAFIDVELIGLRPLWLEVMTKAVEAADEIRTGWPASNRSSFFADTHGKNGDLVELLYTIQTATTARYIQLEGRRWFCLNALVRVQPVAIAIACRYLYTLHPESGTSRRSRRRALGELASMADFRRTMILAQQPFARYFKGFFSRGLAKLRFGPLAGPRAAATNPPVDPEDQIDQLLQRFPKDTSAPFEKTATAVMTSSPPGAPPSSKQRGPSKQSEGFPMHPQGRSVQPPGPPVQPPGAPTHPSGPLLASGPGLQGSDPSLHLGARPRTYSQVAASGAQKRAGMSPKNSSRIGSHGVQHPAGKPGGHTHAVARSSSYGGRDLKKQPGGASGPPAPQIGTAWDVGLRLRQGKGPESKTLAFEDLMLFGKEEASPVPWAKAEGGTSREYSLSDEAAEVLEGLVVAEEEVWTFGDGDGDEAVRSPHGSPSHASQATHAPSSTKGDVPFASSSWAAPGTPMGPQAPDVMPSFSPRGGAFYGVAQGAPRPRSTWPPPAPGFSGPLRFAGPVPHTLQRHSGSLGVSPENPLMSQFSWPSSIAGPAASKRQILLGPQAPPGEPLGIPRASVLTPSPPPGFTGPSPSEGPLRQVLQRPTGPFGPLSSINRGALHAPLLGEVQHPLESDSFPHSPSLPFPLRPFHPSQPSVGGPPQTSSSVSSVRGASLVAPSMPSVLGPLPSFSAPASIWSPSSPAPSLPSPFPNFPLSARPTVSETPFFSPPTSAVFEPPSSNPSPTDKEPSSRTSGVFSGAPLRGSISPVTSGSTAPPPS